MHGIVRHAIKKDVLVFGLPALLVFFAGLLVSAQSGYDGLTATLWQLVTNRREPSDLTTANVIGLTNAVQIDVVP